MKELNKGQLLQISVDSPSVNRAFLKEIQKHREQEELPQLINIGSCCLDIIHVAFQTGATTTCWNIKGTLKAIYKLLHDSPARRADYISVTGSTLFPFSFCATRWVEDKRIADRAIEIWVNECKIIDVWQKLAPSQRPKCKSYTTVVTAVNDQLATAKLQFFSFIAITLQPFLELYQSDFPIILYMFDEIINIVKTCMKLFIKADVVGSCFHKDLKKFIYQVKITSFHLIRLILAVPP